ncbi:MAG: OmpA family protein [Candidatus Omnitrophica bacterium]|nr:OmpA family protein [Candidatus Omnitrophota bacterium]
MRRPNAFFYLCFLMVMVMTTSGCTMIFQKARRADAQKISQLQDELSELERAKAELERRLRDEIADNEVSVGLGDRGLVVTFVSEVLFDSGKAKLREEAFEKLSKVARVLNTTVVDYNIGIEGHTDNVPIKHSGWKSNWELSSARAMSVLHYLIDEEGLAPERLSGTGYGEYHPVASNDDAEGRQKNRRVEIVILPKVVKEQGSIAAEDSKSTENLK